MLVNKANFLMVKCEINYVGYPGLLFLITTGNSYQQKILNLVKSKLCIFFHKHVDCNMHRILLNTMIVHVYWINQKPL